MSIIRPATPADLSALGTALAPLSLFQAYGLTAAALTQRFEAALQRGEGLLLAELEGAPVGVCWFITRGAFGTGAYLRTLAVKEGLQGKGLGVELLRGYEDGSGDPPGGWFLLASDFNTGAHRFYERHGYREVGLLPDFAAKGVTERIYWKPRPPAR
ncbi:GNAT family N-acetyltransferase [Hyalangium minutum]|uniref:Acetyltransferase, GNAT family protein n=1 Tax=Hyalangium minutum TaxID=394096 RepID=A0A085WIV2_9BACT|nr:GNAT family N-acetyltransferase [Hyalangium minutum]KFE67615.1 acetyltransferase, GNAT family protein [Hyalangium minutum]